MAARDPRSRYLLVLSIQPLDAHRSIWTPILFDLARARAIHLRKAPEEEVERALFDSMVKLAAREVGASDRLDEHFVAIFDELQSTFEQSGHAGAFGEFQLSGRPVPYRLTIDGRNLNLQQDAASVRVEHVPPGPHEVRASTPQAQWDVSLELDSGERMDLRFDLGEPLATTHPVRTAALWGAAGASLVGTTLFLVSRLSRDRLPPEAVVTVGALRADSERASFPLALGAGLSTGGVLTGLSTLVFGERSSAPWVQIASGLIVGAATASALYASGTP